MYRTPSNCSAYVTGSAMAETELARTKRGEDVFTSRTIAIRPVRATSPTKPSPNGILRPTASLRAPASA